MEQVKRKKLKEGHTNWEGDVVEAKRRGYSKKVYKDWNAAVKKRDNYTCQSFGCGSQQQLLAHHIKNWEDYPELRFDVDNGKTLCLSCHSLLHRKEENEQLALRTKLTNRPKNIIDAFEKDEFFGKQFVDKHSWRKWVAFLKVIYGLEMNDEEKQIYVDCTKRGSDDIPAGGFEEFYGIIGRRGGKSTISSLIAVYEALFGGWEDKLSPGERGSIFIVAPDKEQAKIIFGYCDILDGMLKNYENMVLRRTTELISLSNGIDIVVKTASKRGLRGFSTVCVILDEIAFLRTDDYANPADEILTALEPSLKEGAKLIGVSTPYAKFGYFYEIYDEYFGKKGSEIMVWQASTLYMNPSYSQRKIRKAKKKSLTSAATEYDAVFREDVSSYLTEIEIDALTETGIKERLPKEGYRYYCFVDVSGARSDSFTFAISHIEEEKIVIDVAYEKIPKYDIDQQIGICSDYMRKFKISQVVGDRYGGEFPIQGFKKQGMQYIQSDLVKSDLYLEFQIICNLQNVILLDNDRTKRQFMILERKAGKSGKDSVEKPRNTHDDIANAISGVAVMTYRKMSRKPSDEELEGRKFRKVSKTGLDYRQSFDKILKEAKKEMEINLKQGRDVPYVSFADHDLIQKIKWWREL